MALTVKQAVQEFPDRVKRLEELVKLKKADYTKLGKAVDKVFVANERKLFATEGVSGGSKWQKLSDDYLTRKRRHYKTQKILTMKGDMRKALTGKNHPDHWRMAYKVQTGLIRVEVGIVDDLRNPIVQRTKAHAIGAHPLPRRDPLQHTDAQHKEMLKAAMGVYTDKLRQVTRSMGAKR
jgi:hypothetical protein